MLRVQVLVEIPDIQQSMTPELRENSEMTFLFEICLTWVASALVVSVIIFVITSMQERERLLKERRTAKARRLRLCTDDSELVPPPLPEDTPPPPDAPDQSKRIPWYHSS